MVGSIALVGSGEYLPEMMELEASLLQDGLQNNKTAKFVQIPTAAGQEGSSRLQYWKDLGLRQAERLGVEQVFLPVFTRNDANNSALAELIDDSALIYLSGGNPGYLADCLRGTLIGERLFQNWQEGSSIAGCSAGAMALCESIMSLRFRTDLATEGLGFIKQLQVLPHFDRYFRFIPDKALQVVLKRSVDTVLVGIDELTALVRRGAETNWYVHGTAAVHILNTNTPRKYLHSEQVLV